MSSAHLPGSVLVCLGITDCYFDLPVTGTAAADIFYTAVPLITNTMTMSMSFHTGLEHFVY